jgi:glycine cleavage system transcriptional repressor
MTPGWAAKALPSPPGRASVCRMSDSHRAVLTAIGVDRPGLVDEVSRFVGERGGNLEDSRMVNLHGQFVIMMLVEGPKQAIEELRAGLDELAAKSRIHVELTSADMGHKTASAALPFRLTTRAMDHPGLVQSVAHTLRGLGVNIESAETTLQSAPITGAPLFEMEFVVSVPPGTRSRLIATMPGVCRR